MSQHTAGGQLFDFSKRFSSLIPSRTNSPYSSLGSYNQSSVGGIAPSQNFEVGNQYNQGKLIPGTNKGGSNDGFSLGEYGSLAQAGVGLYLGTKQLEGANDALDFSRNSFNTNLANQAQLINNDMESRYRSRLEATGRYGRGEEGQAALQSELQSYLKPRQVSGKAI